MGEENLQLALLKYNKKTWFKSGLLGFFIGLAVIIPGVSGSTVAIIFKLYDQFLYAVGNFFKKFKACFAFLLPIAIGAVVGFVLGFLAVRKLLDIIPFVVIYLFAGLMVGAFPAVKDELNGVQLTAKRIVLLVVGACIPVAVGVYSTVAALSGGGGGILNAPLALQIVLPLLVGYVMAITQVVPGLSASAILMAIGWYATLMNGIETALTDVNMLIVVASLAVGFIIGFFTFSKVLVTLLERARASTYSLVVGMALGSVITMFLGGDVVKIYADWAANGVDVLQLVLGIVLLVAGAILSYWLVRVQRKVDAAKASNE
jgi:putative membrane protein